MSIKARQVAGVTTLVVVIVAALSALHLATLARLSLTESASRGEMLARAIYQRAREVVPATGDPYTALAEDGGVRSLLESSIAYSKNVTYAALLNRDGVAVAHSFPTLQGKPMAEQEDLLTLVDAGALAQLRAIYSDRTFEVRQPLLFGGQQFGSIRIGISTLLVRNELQQALNRALQTIVVALLVSSLVAMLLAQWMLRPIHVIQSGLTRLGRGELDVRLDLPAGEEFKGLGSSFEAVSAQLSAVRAKSPSSLGTEFESVVRNLEDAVALFNPDGELIFCNPAMGSVLPGLTSGGTKRLEEMAPPEHPVRQLIERTLLAHHSQGPLSVTVPGPASYRREPDSRTPPPTSAELQLRDVESERLLVTHAIDDAEGKFVGAMLVARNLGYLTQVHSTLKYSRKLAALGRLMAGVAHEVKNPLNAMTIHLELLKQKLAPARQPVLSTAGGLPGAADIASPSVLDVSKHVDVIGSEIHRLDHVVSDFLKFARPEELKLQPVQLASVISDIATTITPEAELKGLTIKSECGRESLEINADPAMLRQALLNLALNACQATPQGGTVKLSCRPSHGRVEIDVEDTGIGIPPENLGQIFDLYFTTKEKGSGIGLSMVYRIVQLHDGEVEVQSTPGHGTRFRLVFPRA